MALNNHGSQPVEQAKNLVKQASSSATPQKSIGELFANLSGQVSTLVRGEIELAKAEAVAKVTKMGIGIGFFAAAGFLAIYLLAALMHSLAHAFAALVGPALGYLITAGIILLLMIILALLGVASLKRSSKHTIEPGKGLKQSVNAVKKGFQK